MKNPFSRKPDKTLSPTTVNQAFEKIKHAIHTGDIATASIECDKLAKAADEICLSQAASLNGCYAFSELFEELLFVHYNRPEKPIGKSPFPFAEIYLLYGSLLFEQKKYLEAREELAKAKRWNPASARVLFEYMETFKVLGDFDTLLELNKEAFRYAFTPRHIARCYRDLGYYLIEKKLFKEAAGCYLISLQYDKTANQAKHELAFIQATAPQCLIGYAPDDLIKSVEHLNIVPTTTKDIAELAVALAYHFVANNNIESAIYCLDIACNLSDDEVIKNLVKTLKTKLPPRSTDLKPALRLANTRGSKQQYTARLNSIITVGRVYSSADICISNQTVSRRHCEFEFRNERLYLRDTNSTNGTFILSGSDWKRLWGNESVEVKNGDIIRLGSEELSVHICID